LLALQAFKFQHLIDARFERRAVRAGVDHHFLHGLERALVDTANADTTHVAGVVERANLQLQSVFRTAFVGGHVFQNRIKQRGQVNAAVIAVFALRQGGPTVQARGVNDGEVELLFGRTELVKQVEGGVDDVVRA